MYSDANVRAPYVCWVGVISEPNFAKTEHTFFHVKVDQKVAGDRHIAGENNGRLFKFKVAEKFYQINTNNFHNHDHA